jgi:hypothetical protein
MSWDGFAYMASALQKLQPNAATCHRRDGLGPTAAMLQALGAGRCDAAALATAAQVRSALVMPLLKNHIRARRVLVVRDGGRTFYELAAAADVDLQAQLERACRLLRQHGWMVEAPGAGPPKCLQSRCIDGQEITDAI